MTREYLKKAALTPKSDASEPHKIVQGILNDIEAGGDAKALEYAAKFDRYVGNVLLTDEEIEAACALVPEKLKADIRFSHDNVRRFAELQKGTMQDVETEISPGFVTGQKVIPVDAAGCYVPGGRYSHIASAIMTVTTAKVAGCKHIVATDLVSQAEHGYNSPVWLVTDDRKLAEEVMRLVPGYIDDLPEVNCENATAAWRDYAEVILCADREDMAACSDEYAPEHLTVQTEDLDWWLQRLTCYGSLFLGEETTVSYGDKAAGTNHVLPTSRAASYTGGLSVHKYMKIVTWQRATREGSKPVAEATARIARLEGMEGHARAADVRLAKYFPNETFDLTANG